jgi:hypothetical protein
MFATCLALISGCVIGQMGKSGEGGIRTLGRISPTPVFETGPIGRSGTSPKSLLIDMGQLTAPVNDCRGTLPLSGGEVRPAQEPFPPKEEDGHDRILVHERRRRDALRQCEGCGRRRGPPVVRNPHEKSSGGRTGQQEQDPYRRGTDPFVPRVGPQEPSRTDVRSPPDGLLAVRLVPERG